MSVCFLYPIYNFEIFSTVDSSMASKMAAKMENSKKKYHIFAIMRFQHHLEYGRYITPKTPIAERLCKQCSVNAVEDESHFYWSVQSMLTAEDHRIKITQHLNNNLKKMHLSHICLNSNGF